MAGESSRSGHDQDSLEKNAVQEESLELSAEKTDNASIEVTEQDEKARKVTTVRSHHLQPADETTPGNPNTPENTLRDVSRRGFLDTIKQTLLWTPPSCRYDPEKPPDFTLGLNLLFSFATTATVGNLYYNQPILYQIAATFDVSYERASSIATLMQAGYAAGIVLLCPPADLLPRRPYILALVAITALFWLGLCITNSFLAFSGLSFVCGFTTVTPQLMLPLVGDLAPPHRRAAAVSIVVSGLSLGMLVARVLSGVVSNYTSWRNIYWFSLAAQAAVFFSLYFLMPDYPTKNRARAAVGHRSGFIGVSHYCRVLYYAIVLLVVRQPVLAQACLVAFCLSAVFTSYWTTLSFLLASPPYNYPAFAIGLFGLIGIVVICFGPLYGRFVIDHIVPVVAVLSGTIIEVAGVAVGVAIGPYSVAGPVIQAIFVDFGNQASNIALRASIYGLAPQAQNRVNSAYMIASFTGQLTGTAAGNRLYAQGGWRYSGGLSIGLLCFAILVTVARGPRETGWVGWHGGWAIRRGKILPIPYAVAKEDGGETGVLVDGGKAAEEK